MSDQFFKPEERPVPEGAEFPEQVLTADNEQKNRSGFTGRQNQMADSIGRGTQTDIPQGSNPRVKPGQVNGVGATVSPVTDNGMSLAGVNVTVKPVDRRTIDGSYPGDSRQRGADVTMPANPGPREPKGQAGS